MCGHAVDQAVVNVLWEAVCALGWREVQRMVFFFSSFSLFSFG